MEDKNNNIITQFKGYIDIYIAKLNVEISKTKSKIERDKRKSKILEFTYGLKSKYYTREELSFLLNLTIERVRQIWQDVIKEIQTEIKSQENNIFPTSYYDNIAEFKKDLIEIGVLSQNGFKEYVKKYDIDTNNDVAYLNLLIDILEFKVQKTHLHLLKDNDLIFFNKAIDSKQFIRVCYAVFISIEKNAILTELEDIIIGVRKELKKDKFPVEYVLMALKAIDNCEVVSKNEMDFYQISFHKLSSGSDMAYRVLFEKNERINLSDLFREINYRLNESGRKKVDKASLQQQLNMDKRFVPLGKTSFWTLAEWGEDNLSMYELITNTLIHFNRPLTKNEIFSNIHKSRPFIKSRSLDTVIYDSRYKQLKDKKFILSEWKNSYSESILKTERRNTAEKENKVTEQIKQQILNLFEENNTNEILLSAVVNILKKKFKFPKNSTYRVISEEGIFVTIPVDNYRKKVLLKNKIKMDKPKNKSTSVFVSYSWNGENYKEKVIAFVNFLREKGFEADMDIKLMQEETAIDFNRLMHKGILEYDKVIILLSENYKTKSEKFEGGVGKEYRFIINDIEKNPKKYILSSFEEVNSGSIGKMCPIDFLGREILDLIKDENENFERLFAKLTESKKYLFSDVASETPIIEKKKIEKFTLKNN